MKSVSEIERKMKISVAGENISINEMAKGGEENQRQAGGKGGQRNQEN
jgi:hypothetical protein